MREIKFEYGFDNHAPIIYTLSQIEFGLDFSETGVVKYRRQFTGLRDKNGVETYFDDIVKAVLIDKKGNKMGEFVGKVSFGEFEIQLDMESDFFPCASWLLIYSFEVIGNIHQNPELLEQSE